MDILIINNETKHLDKLTHLLENYQFKIISPLKINLNQTKNFKLIILTGSTHNSVLGNLEFYQKEIELIKKTQTPIIGVCLGLELIAYAFNNLLYKYEEKIKKITEIKISLSLTPLNNFKTFTAYEAHHWGLLKVKKPLLEIASSENGVEIIKHQNRDIWGLQFHPEVEKPKNEGSKIFQKLLEYYLKKE